MSHSVCVCAGGLSEEEERERERHRHAAVMAGIDNPEELGDENQLDLARVAIVLRRRALRDDLFSADTRQDNVMKILYPK